MHMPDALNMHAYIICSKKKNKKSETWLSMASQGLKPHALVCTRLDPAKQDTLIEMK